MLPDIVLLAVRSAISHEASVGLVKTLLTLGTAETVGVPLEVGRHAHDVPVEDGRAAATAHRLSRLLPTSHLLPSPRLFPSTCHHRQWPLATCHTCTYAHTHTRTYYLPHLYTRTYVHTHIPFPKIRLPSSMPCSFMYLNCL